MYSLQQCTNTKRPWVDRWRERVYERCHFQETGYDPKCISMLEVEESVYALVPETPQSHSAASDSPARVSASAFALPSAGSLSGPL